MISDYIGGGQVFLHKVRMFWQVIASTFKFALIFGLIGAVLIKLPLITSIDRPAAFSYVRASISLYLDQILPSYSKNRPAPTINAHTKDGLYLKDMAAKSVIKSNKFSKEYFGLLSLMLDLMVLSLQLILAGILIIFAFWSRFGKEVKSDKKINGGKLLNASEVKKALKAARKCSSITIGDMPLVKDSETQHFLVTGATGSGKTNLFHNILPQIIAKGQPAVVIDQTGEMIAKYYDEKRGDIIFNPFDKRGKAWDFWTDCASPEELARFASILFSFNRKKHGASSDPFWEQSAEVIFTSYAQYLQDTNDIAIDSKLKELNNLISNMPLKHLADKLAGYPAERYLSGNNPVTAGSILSVLATNSKPMSYLADEAEAGKFSVKEYFNGLKGSQEGSKQTNNQQNIKQNNKPDSWLFLATKPSSRELTLPIISCLTDLALSILMEIGISRDRRVWFVTDELASLGKLPALSTLMAEGRKYGLCVIAGLQSLNQLYANYGQHDGSTIFGQFGTSFFFRNSEPTIGKMISLMCGQEIISKQQKNTSFGANSFRDGQSYTEQEKTKNLVEYSDLTQLAVGECYVLMPEPAVRLAKIQVPMSNMANSVEGFMPLAPKVNKGEALAEEQKQNQHNQQNTSQINSETPSSDLVEVMSEGAELKIEDNQQYKL